MATIDATVGGTSANSYVTLAEADAYWADHYHSSAWDALADDDKNKLLIMATRNLDNWVIWEGSRSDEEQALRLPRYGMTDCDNYQIDGDVIPTNVKYATHELAAHLISFNPSAEPDTKGFSKIKVDVIELEIDKMDRDSVTVIPDTVSKLLECFGETRVRGGGMVVGLGRA